MNMPKLVIYGFVPTSFGTDALLAFAIENDEEKICFLHFTSEPNSPNNENLRELKKIWCDAKLEEDNVLSAAIYNKYVTNPIYKNSASVILKGTRFQKIVWNALLNIPYGTVVTYSELAMHIKQPNAVRTVASAVARNNIAIIVPCHRVVSKNGNKLKYRWGSDIKKFLLDKESTGSNYKPQKTSH